MKAKDIMNREVLTVSPDLNVDQLARFLNESEISGAPVVDEQGRLIGVVSLRDVAEVIGHDSDTELEISDFFIPSGEPYGIDFQDLEGLPLEGRKTTVFEIMNPDVRSVAPDADVSEVAKAMLDNSFHRILVTEKDRLLGIITTMDMLRLLLNREFSD